MEAKQLRRRWPRRLLIVVNVCVAIALVAVGAGYGYAKYRFGQVKKLACPECQASPAGASGEPTTILVVGTDSRRGVTKQEAKAFCQRADCSDQAGPDHSDTIILLHLDPKQRKAAVLSIPRDLNVAVAGTRHHDRINAASSAGIGILIQTLQQNFGIAVNHFVVVNFIGFRSIVNSIGGIDVAFPTPARDRFSGLNVATAGCVHLGGNAALGYVRSRHYEYLEGGRWRSDPFSDLSRIQRQQDFLRRVFRKVANIRNPLEANAVLGNGVHSVNIDDKLTQGDIVSLASRFHSLSPDTFDMLSLPTDPLMVGGADELQLHQPDATAVIQRFLQLSPPAPAATAVSPNVVHVRLVTAAVARAAAGAASGRLARAGFVVTGTSEDSGPAPSAPTIRYGDGQLAKASLLLSYLPGARLVPDSTLTEDGLVLVAAPDLKVSSPPMGSAGQAAAPPVATPGPVAPTGKAAC